MPKSAEQEKLEGNPGHRKVNKSALVPSRDIPNPPRWLGKIAARHYHDLVRQIGPNGMRVMAASDRDALAVVCDIYEKYRNCREVLKKNGEYFEHTKEVSDGKGGVEIVLLQIKRHPAVVDQQKYYSLYMTGLGKFGLTPYERQKVSTVGELEVKAKSPDEIRAERKKKALELVKKSQKVVNG